MLKRRLLKQSEGVSGLRDLFPSIEGPSVLPHTVTGRIFGGVGVACTPVLILTLLLIPAMAAQQVRQTKSDAATLRGTVHDHSGKPVGDAHVVLLGQSLPVTRETSTDAAGGFTFLGVTMGAFTLTANSGPLRSAAVSVTVSAPGDQPAVDLVLGASAAPADVNQAMQFADNPDFAIAAVTDWTAAGGHGSDAILRTSEALAQEAVKLKPQGAQAATAGLPGAASETKESESALRAAVEKNSKSFAENQRLGLFYLQAGRYEDAVPPLRAAYQADSANYDNEYDLMLALKMAGDPAQARDHIKHLIARRETADLRRMEGELDEKLGDPLSAVHEFQAAASEDPSEDNYFAWGSELLIHRAVWQAKEVFDKGVGLYPRSSRMLTARGAALFAGALYDDAALELCRASDLNPGNVETYLFLGKVEVAAPNPLPCVVAKLERFKKLQPTNSLANYYYAMALRKQEGEDADPHTVERVKDLLTQAVALDPKCADGYLELGNMSADEKQWAQAISHYLNAIHADPNLSEAHYRLGIAYDHTGEKDKAREQFQLHVMIARDQAAEVERQREAVKQFLVISPDQMGKEQPR